MRVPRLLTSTEADMVDRVACKYPRTVAESSPGEYSLRGGFGEAGQFRALSGVCGAHVNVDRAGTVSVTVLSPRTLARDPR